MLGTNPVVSSQEPCFQVPKNNVNHWQVLVRLGVVTLDQHYLLLEAQFFQVVVTSPCVCSNLSSRLYVFQDERLQRFLLAIWESLEP